MNIIAILLSGGTGSRLHTDVPKQYLRINGEMVISHPLRTLFTHPGIDAVRIVASSSWRDIISTMIGDISRGGHESPVRPARFSGYSDPGKTRALSILNALRDIRDEADYDDLVIIHDAARPSVSEGLITRLIDGASGHDGALPVLPMKDTVYLSDADIRRVDSLLPRARVVAGQAPEAFLYGRYLEAYEALLPDRIYDINGSTEPALLYGMDIALIEGEESNYKITTPEDLARFARGRGDGPAVP